jgi:hypothetical protein
MRKSGLPARTRRVNAAHTPRARFGRAEEWVESGLHRWGCRGSHSDSYGSFPISLASETPPPAARRKTMPRPMRGGGLDRFSKRILMREVDAKCVGKTQKNVSIRSHFASHIGSFELTNHQKHKKGQTGSRLRGALGRWSREVPHSTSTRGTKTQRTGWRIEHGKDCGLFSLTGIRSCGSVSQ